MTAATKFHPDQNLPGCMMPDGGDCCAGHAAVVEDWHKQRREIERLRDMCINREEFIAQHNLWKEFSQYLSEPRTAVSSTDSATPPIGE